MPISNSVNLLLFEYSFLQSTQWFPRLSNSLINPYTDNIWPLFHILIYLMTAYVTEPLFHILIYLMTAYVTEPLFHIPIYLMTAFVMEFDQWLNNNHTSFFFRPASFLGNLIS